ncbi:MAG: mevalonate kinase [Candidatus Undinarchaeales archaeon]
MAEGGYGKTILFNEHFVVYGIPAIASAINDQTTAEVELTDDLTPSGNEGSMAGEGWVLEDNREANPGYKEKKLEQQKDSIKRVLKAVDFDTTDKNIKITVNGNLKAVGGVGASAAICVAVARALNRKFDLDFDDEKINEIAYEGEKAYAGTPSGIDNTASTFGGLIWFEKTDEGSKIDRLSLENPVEIVLGNTGLTTDTAKAVAGVKERKEKNPEKYNKLFEQARNLVGKAKEELLNSNFKEVGKLMNKNHTLLKAIEVSHPKLDELVDIARENGAYGAKMTGGGLGGYMLALTPGKELQDKVAEAMEEAGYEALKTKIGV